MRRFEKFRSIFPYIIIVLASVLVFTKPLGNSDELWNYNFAINILDGNLPYRDFSIVQTPLSCYISAFFMLIFGRGLLSFKVLTYVLFVVTSALVFDLSKKTSGNSIVAICATAVTMSAHFLCYIYNYNYLTALVILVILEIEYIKKDTFGANLIVGLLVGTTILIKQNTGLIIWIANLSDDEYSAVLQWLIRLENSLIAQGRYTDRAPDVLCKVLSAKKRMFKIKYI